MERSSPVWMIAISATLSLAGCGTDKSATAEVDAGPLDSGSKEGVGDASAPSDDTLPNGCVKSAEGCVESPTCNRDCSTSDCGDKIINAAASETCDDGNKIAFDGCHSCQAYASWCVDVPVASARIAGGPNGMTYVLYEKHLLALNTAGDAVWTAELDTAYWLLTAGSQGICVAGADPTTSEVSVQKWTLDGKAAWPPVKVAFSSASADVQACELGVSGDVYVAGAKRTLPKYKASFWAQRIGSSNGIAAWAAPAEVPTIDQNLLAIRPLSNGGMALLSTAASEFNFVGQEFSAAGAEVVSSSKNLHPVDWYRKQENGQGSAAAVFVDDDTYLLATKTGFNDRVLAAVKATRSDVVQWSYVLAKNAESAHAVRVSPLSKNRAAVQIWTPDIGDGLVLVQIDGAELGRIASDGLTGITGVAEGPEGGVIVAWGNRDRAAVCSVPASLFANTTRN